MTDHSFQTNRRTVLRTGLGMIAGASAVAAATRQASAQEKLAQELVQYQATPKDGLICSACVNWVAPNGCTIVTGNISPNGWCVAYAPNA